MQGLKVKTSLLTDAPLDWAVGKIEGIEMKIGEYSLLHPALIGGKPKYDWIPSASWGQGGDIIQRNKIVIEYLPDGTASARCHGQSTHYYGPVPLVAAMRSYVALKTGEEVWIPEEIFSIQKRINETL